MHLHLKVYINHVMLCILLNIILNLQHCSFSFNTQEEMHLNVSSTSTARNWTAVGVSRGNNGLRRGPAGLNRSWTFDPCTPCLKICTPTFKILPNTLGSGDAKCHPWGPVEGCMNCGNVEAGVGSIRTHPSTPPRFEPCRRRQGRRSVPKTLDDPKLIANWGRSVQSIHEEVGTGG